MRIQRIRAFPVKLQFREPFIISNLTSYDMFYVIVQLTTDEGITGYGEAIPAWEVTGETQLGVIDVINHFCDPAKTGIDLVGQDISTLEAVTALIGRMNPPDGLQIIWGAPSAKAALEGAILDAYGKHVDRPIYSLFDGKREPIPVTHVIGVHPVEETLQRVDRAIDAGAGIIKLKVGIEGAGSLSGYERDRIVVTRSREMVSAKDPAPRLVADANQGYITPKRALEMLDSIEGCLDWMEQPVLAGDKLGLKHVKERCSTPIMADEAVHDAHDAELLLELGAVDYLNIKLMKTGGMLGALRLAELAAQYGVPCQMGSMLENQIGTALCAHAYLCHSNIATTELCSLGMLREWIGHGIEVGDNHLALSDAPGLGIRVSEAEIFEHLIAETDSATLKQIRNGFRIP